MVLSSLATHSSSLYHYHLFPDSSPKQTYSGFSLQSSRPISKRALRSVCFLKAGDEKSKPDIIQDKVTHLNSAATHYNESLLLAFFGLRST